MRVKKALQMAHWGVNGKRSILSGKYTIRQGSGKVSGAKKLIGSHGMRTIGHLISRPGKKKTKGHKGERQKR